MSPITSSVLLLSLASACLCAENPCPEHVNFRKIEGKPVVRIKVKNDYSGRYEVVVNSTLPYVDTGHPVLVFEDIQELNKRDVPELVYTLKYPGKLRGYPRIKQIVYNGVTICKADPSPDDATMNQTYKKVTATNQIQFAGNNKRVSREVSNLINGGENRCGVYDEGAPGFPWLGALFAYNVAVKNYEYICTVTLISTQHVITAANCVQNQNLLNFDVDDLVLIFGKPLLDNWVQKSVIAYADKVTVHPVLAQKKAGPDLAILTLSTPLYLSENVRPVCLENRSDSAADSGIISGWGKTRQNRLNSTTPYQAKLKMVDREECKTIHETLRDDSFCAGEKEDKRPCGRNIGAAYLADKKDKVYYLHGIATFLNTQRGHACENYTIFTDVTKEFEWIDSVIN